MPAQRQAATGSTSRRRTARAARRRPLLVHTVATEDGPATLALRGLSDVEFDALLSAHPDPERLALYDEDTFGPALIAACLAAAAGPEADPADLPDEAEVTTWWQTWPPEEVDALFGTCLAQSAPGSVQWALDRLSVDDRFASELAYCGPAGIPHSVFLTWPRADQDKAIAWAVSKGDRCPGCGVPSEAMGDPEAARVKAVRCVHCEALAVATEDVPPDQRSAIHVHVQPYSTAERAQLAAGIDPDASRVAPRGPRR